MLGVLTSRQRSDHVSLTGSTPAPPPCENKSRGPRRDMIERLLNLLFRCSHRRLTRPVAPITKHGQPHSQSYVVCLDCGKEFEYDLSQMRMGKAIDRSQ
jgi:DNA-directed RNA polymerase subunit RPC12/RpoP